MAAAKIDGSYGPDRISFLRHVGISHLYRELEDKGSTQETLHKLYHFPLSPRLR